MLLFALLLHLFSFSATAAAPTADLPPLSPLPAALYLSADQGKIWNSFMDGLPEDVQPLEVVEQGGHLYLTTRNYGVYLLPAGDCTWQPRSNGLPLDKKFHFFPTSLVAQGKVLVLGTFSSGVYLSKDGGATWQRPIFNISDVVGSLLFTNDLLLAGTQNGIWQSFDRGESWQLRRPDKNVRTNALALHGGKIFVAKQNGMGILNGSDIAWSDLVSEWAIIRLIQQGDYLYAVSAKNEIYRTRDGSVWQKPSSLRRPGSDGSLAGNSGAGTPSGFRASLPPAWCGKPRGGGWWELGVGASAGAATPTMNIR